MPWSRIAIGAGFALSLLGCGSLVAAQEVEPLCIPDASTATETPADPLAGRLGGTRDSFEARFGPPAEEDGFSLQYDLEGCEYMTVDYEEGRLTRVYFSGPGASDLKGEWAFADAMQIAQRLLPLDVQQGEPFRNVSFVEHQPCTSSALAEQVPSSVYADLDNNPVQGQCSVAYEFDDAGQVISFTVQLQVEDMP